MQVRSIEHLQTWLKRDSRLSNELLIKPLDVRLEQVEKSFGAEGAWWKNNTNEEFDKIDSA